MVIGCDFGVVLWDEGVYGFVVVDIGEVFGGELVWMCLGLFVGVCVEDVEYDVFIGWNVYVVDFDVDECVFW